MSEEIKGFSQEKQYHYKYYDDLTEFRVYVDGCVLFEHYDQGIVLSAPGALSLLVFLQEHRELLEQKTTGQTQ